MNNYSQIVQPAKFVAPQDLNLLLKGTMYKQDMAEKNLSHVQSAVDNILSIPAYGKDKEVLNNLIQELQSSLSALDTTNLNDPRSTQQINELINSYSNNPDIKNIAQRGFSYENEIAKKKEAEAKGKTYVSPIINQAEKYFNSGEYVKDKQFNEVGWISPEIEKLKAEALKNVPKVTKNKKVGNYWTSVESYDNDALQSTLSEIYSRPDVQRDLNYRMQQEYEANGVDFTTEATQEAQTIMQKAQIALQIDPTDTKAQKVLDNYSLLLSSPEKLTEAYKRRKANESVQKYIQSDIAAADFESEGKMDADDFDLKYVDHVYKLDEIRVQGEKEIAVKTELARLGLTSDGSSLSRPDYDAFQNIVSSSQTRMTDDYNMFSDELQNIGDYTGDDPTYLKDKKVIPFTAIPSVIQNVILDFDVVKNSLKNGEKLTGIIVDESDPSNKKYTPVISNSSGTNFKVAKNSGQDVVVDDNSIKMKTLAVKKEKIPGSNLPQTQSTNNTQYGEIELEDGSKVKAVILSNPSDTSSLKPGEYAIVNGQPFLK